MRRCTEGSWQASLSAIESAWPRTIAASGPVSRRGGSGKRTLPVIRPGRSAAYVTSRSGLRASARRQPVTARLNGSVGLSLPGALMGLLFELMTAQSAQRHVHRTFRQLDAEAALVELRYDRPLELIALVEEGEPEGKADILEDVGILRPGDHRARAHHRRDVAVHEGVASEVGDAHHLIDDFAAGIGAVRLGLGQHDLDFVVM